MIDLGHWAAEDYRIPGQLAAPGEDSIPPSNE
jgi:endogenous inhibitor of DNA gyrase (YacG/DUF329 family)